MKATITNNSRAPQGVHTESGLAFIEPGDTRAIDVAEGYVERVKALRFLNVRWDDPLDHDGDGAKGGAAPNDPPSERDDLKLQAKELGLEHPRNISTEKLRQMIDAKLAE